MGLLDSPTRLNHYNTVINYKVISFSIQIGHHLVEVSLDDFDNSQHDFNRDDPTHIQQAEELLTASANREKFHKDDPKVIVKLIEDEQHYKDLYQSILEVKVDHVVVLGGNRMISVNRADYYEKHKQFKPGESDVVTLRIMQKQINEHIDQEYLKGQVIFTE